jgi:hypothetical protein
MVTITGFAVNQSGKPDKIQAPEQDPYEYIKVPCKAVFQSKTSPASLNEPAAWNFHGYITNKTGQVIPKGAKIVVSFASNLPGYFQTNKGGVPVLNQILILKEALAVDDELFVGEVTFKTTKSPAQLNGSAVYWKKKN